MRKILAVLIAVLLTILYTCATADEGFRMAGFDGDNSGHDWQTNYFFEKMGVLFPEVSFSFDQYTDHEVWQREKENLLTGDHCADVLFKAELTPQETMAYYEKGLLIDLKPLLQENAPNLWALLQENPSWEKAITLPDGAIAALPNLNPLQNNNLIWINQSWMNNLKLENPATADELTEVLRTFKNGDPNRNGKTDEIPISFIGMWDLKWLSHAFGINANDYYLSMDDEGNVTEVLTTDAWRSFLEWLNLLWKENLIDHNGFSTADTLRQITDSKADMIYGLFMGPTALNVVPAECMNQYAVMMPLQYEGKQVYRSLLGDVVRGTFAITSSCKNPEILLKWVDYLYTKEGSLLAQCGEEGIDYFWNEKGRWEWMSDASTVANSILPEHTIAEGGAAPGLTSVEFQLQYDDENTRTAIAQIASVGEISSMPCLYVYPDEETQKKIMEIQLSLSAYAESTMACFVTGDIELNDENWTDFCTQVRALGIDELVSAFNNMLN